MAYVGLLVRVPEVVNNAAFIVIFPLTFVANTFVTRREPARPAGDLRASGTRSPSVTQAARDLFGNTDARHGADRALVAAEPRRSTR